MFMDVLSLLGKFEEIKMRLDVHGKNTAEVKTNVIGIIL